MSTTMNAAVHLEPNFIEHFGVYRNTNFQELQNLWNISQKLILDDQAEILDVTPIDWTAPSWARSTTSHEQVITWTKARVGVYSNSVLCVEQMSTYSDFVLCVRKMSDHSEANRR